MGNLKVKILSAATAVTLLASATTDCAGGGTASSEKLTSPNTSANISSNASITLTITAAMGSKNVRNGIMSDPVAKYIKDKTGVSMNMTIVQDGADYAQKLNALISSNDLTDIMYIPPDNCTAQVSQMAKADEIIPLDGLVSKYAKNISSDKLAQAMVKANKIQSPDGNLYTIGLCRGSADTGKGSTVGNYIRWDLYKKLGYPAIHNYDDLINVLAQMQKLEPKTKDGKKTYAVGSFKDTLYYAALGQQTLSKGIDLGYEFMISGDIQDFSISPKNLLKNKDSDFYSAYKFLNKLNQMGLVDPDTFTQTYSNYQDKCKAKTYMYIGPSWCAGTDSYCALPASSFGAKECSLYTEKITGERQYAISKTCKYPERAVQLLDFMSSYDFSRIASNGLEGTNWSMKDGKPTPTADYLKLTTSSDADAIDANRVSTGAGLYNFLKGYQSGTVDPKTNTSVDTTIDATPLTEVQQDFVKHYGKTALPDVYKEGMTTYKNYSNVVNACGTLPDELKTYETNLSSYENQGMVKLVLAKDDADFSKVQDDFIKGLDTYKIDDIFKAYHDNAVSNTDKMKPVYDMLK